MSASGYQQRKDQLTDALHHQRSADKPHQDHGGRKGIGKNDAAQNALQRAGDERGIPALILHSAKVQRGLQFADGADEQRKAEKRRQKRDQQLRADDQEQGAQQRGKAGRKVAAQHGQDDVPGVVTDNAVDAIHCQRRGQRIADQLSGNILCNDFRDQYDKLASDFFDRIADYGKKEKRNLFYTGANIESLILQTHRALRRSCHDVSKITFEGYRDALFQTAIGGDSQPYGETNMKDIALSWLEARQNQYMQAGKGDLFSFRNFDEGIYDEKETLRRKPQFLKRPETDNEYDRQMFERIQEEICNLQEKINCRDRF